MGSNLADMAGGNTGVAGSVPRTLSSAGGLQPSGSYATTQAQPQASGGGGSSTNDAGSAQDPFAYTMGSLLTPWTKQFQYTPTAGSGEQPESGGGGPSTPPPTFGFDNLSYSFRDPGAYNAPAALQAPSDFSGARQTQAGAFQATPDMSLARYTPGNYAAPTYDPGGSFNPTSALTIDRYTPMAAFQAPTVTDDPGYQFRMQQGQKALEASKAAAGTLRGGATMQALLDYGQQAGSQEYAAAYQRAFGQYQDQENQNLAAYDRNSAAQTAENQTAYQRASSEYDRTQANNLAAFQTNEQAREYAAGLNANQQQFAFTGNNQAAQAENQSTYDRRSQEYAQQVANSQHTEETNYARSASENQQNFENQANVYNLNAQTQQGAYQADAAAAAAMGNLGWNVASGTYDRNLALAQYNYGNAMNAYNMANAPSGGSGGGLTEAQDYNRQLQQYQMDYDIFNNNQATQYSRLMGLAGIGASAAGQVGAGAANNALGAGNAAAAGVVGSQNAYTGLANQAASYGQLALLAGMQQRPLPSPTGAGSGMGPM
jgi:hypothetical protein